MKNLVILLLVFFILIAATSEKPYTLTEPTQPKDIVCFIGNVIELQTKILSYSKSGYILKEMELIDDNGSGNYNTNGIVVMEKYR